MDTKTIRHVYLAVIGMIILSFVPNIWASLLAVFAFFGVLIAAYVIRSEADRGDLVRNHMTYIIATLWAGSFVMLLGMIASSAVLLKGLDHAPLMSCLEPLVGAAQNGDVERVTAELNNVHALIQPCWESYWIINARTIILAAAITIGPTLAYFGWRIFRGLHLSARGENFANPKRWI